MVTEQASEHNLSNLSGARSDVSTERLLNLLELSNSDLTASTGMEELPVTEMLLDTLLGVLQTERPDLLAHSQRVAFLCYGMGRQFGWSAKRTNTLVSAALLHELGKLAASSTPCSFWDETADDEELSRYVTIDLLETCHADSDLLEILAQSLHFRYREKPPEESECPTPEHVLLGAAAFQFAHLFEKVRHQRSGSHHLSEIVAALHHVAEIPIEEQVVAALEEWLAGRDKIIHSFDPSMFFPGNQNMDEETASFVRTTFVEILDELYNLQNDYDAFFILDSTGRFQLWNSGCQLHHGHTIREMRNKHWHNSLIGYCNHEGLAFSDAQTPLFQTLESGKPARTTLFLKKGEHNLIEAEVASIPIMGRDKLMLGIVELHRIHGAQEQPSPDILYTPEWISELSGELRRQVQEEPEAHTIPDLDDELILIIESRLGIAPDLDETAAAVTATEFENQTQEDASSTVDLDQEEDEDAIVLDPHDSDILTEEEIAKRDAPKSEELELTESETALGAVESDTVASEEPEPELSLESDTALTPENEGDGDGADELEDTVADFVLEDESSDDDDLPELGSHLDNLLSRFDDIVTETVDSEETAEEAASAEPENAATTASPADDGRDHPEGADTEAEFEETDPETSEQSGQQSAAEPVESEPTAEGEPQESAASATDQSSSDHVLESSLELGHAVEFAESEETADENSSGVLDEDDVLSFLMEDSYVETKEPPAPVEAADEPAETAPEHPAETAETEEPPVETPPSVEESEEVESPEDAESASVADSEDQADFELSLDVELSDSELLRALEDEELAAEDESDDSSAVADAITESPAVGEVADQTEEVAAEPEVPAFEEVAEEPAVDEVEETAEEPSSELVEEASEEPASEPEEDVFDEKPVTEQPAESLAGTAADVEPAAEDEPEPQPLTEAAPQDVEESETLPVSAIGRGETEGPSAPPIDSETQTAPVSRAEWDAFVSYLLDPNSADREQVAVLFLDLDRFKAINEGFGRQIGDDLLKEISRRLSEACGSRELSCRYGGGQFAISCPGLTLEKASKRGDQIRKLIERTRFDVLPFQALTVSIGVASSEQGDTLDKLMNRAEHSLYNAKSSGRNCVVAMSSEQIEAELAQEEEDIHSVTTDKPFEVAAEFEAMIASDMIVYKLGGFLYDMHAKLLHVDKRHVSMRVGSKGFLPYWGRQDDARPVLIDLELGEGWGEQNADQIQSKKSIIHIRIRPDGWVRNQETFYKRAQHVLREIKGYFAGS